MQIFVISCVLLTSVAITAMEDESSDASNRSYSNIVAGTALQRQNSGGKRSASVAIPKKKNSGAWQDQEDKDFSSRSSQASQGLTFEFSSCQVSRSFPSQQPHLHATLPDQTKSATTTPRSLSQPSAYYEYDYDQNPGQTFDIPSACGGNWYRHN